MTGVAAVCSNCGISYSLCSLYGGQIPHSSPAQRTIGGYAGLKVQGKSSDQGRDKEVDKEKKKEKTSLFTSITDALDFAQTRSEKDAELLEDARTATKSGEKMNREQYSALRRKVGGTYRDFFKDSVEVIGDYVDDGWVDKKCRYCQKDTSSEPRTVDNLGRYAHVACAESRSNGNIFSRWFSK